ncbi:hypothetical protein Drorol1_Dr00007727 [Drosera rotundifolia]
MAVPDENGGGAAAVAVKPYPAPEADNDEIVHDVSLFSEKLRRFHASFDTELSFPNIGGKELDLHRLFVQVTSRGGLEKAYYFRKTVPTVSGDDTFSTLFHHTPSVTDLKPNRSSYTFFFAEQYAMLSSTYGGNARTISKEIGSLWNELSDGERQVYQDKAVRDKERYRSELFEYNMSHDL